MKATDCASNCARGRDDYSLVWRRLSPEGGSFVGREPCLVKAGRGLLFRSDSRLTSHQLGSLGKIVLQLSVATTG